MIHVVENATGQIVEVVGEGSDVSRFGPPDYTVYNNAPMIDRAKYKYVGAVMEEKVWFEITPTVDSLPADDSAFVDLDIQLLNRIGEVSQVTIQLGDNPNTGKVNVSLDGSGTGSYPGVKSSIVGELEIFNPKENNFWATPVSVAFTEV